jgi:hypothetical protein
VSHFSMQPGRGGGGSGPDYPLRTFVRDEQERLRAEREQQERDRTDRDEVGPPGREGEAGSKDKEREGARGRERESAAADESRGGPQSAERSAPYLLGEDSPLLLYNIPDYVTNTGPAIEAIKARLGEEDRVRDRSERLFDELGKALYTSEPPSQVDAEMLSHRLRAFIVLDSENTKWLAQYYGTGEKGRQYYSILTSPDRLLSNREIKLPLLRLFAEEFPMSRIIGNIHADTDHKHCHVWMSARLANDLKLHIGKEKVGGVWIDRYKGLDERYLVNYCVVVGDPQPLATHLEKKAEWNERKALVKIALAKGEHPPALPFRERLRYDELGERRQRKERREREANGEDPGPKKRAAPVARLRSEWECAELWGKTVHAEARLREARFRRDAFERAPRHTEVEVEGRHWSLHRVEEERRQPGRQREGKEDALRAAERERREAELRAVEVRVSEEVAAHRQLLTREVDEHEADYERHSDAWKKTVENRKAKELSEIKYPLHNARQLDEMRGIAERTRDADLLRYVREYDLLDRPEGRDELRREFSERWSREVMAEVAVHEHEHRLRTALREGPDARTPEPDASARTTAAGRDAEAGRYARLIDEWTTGGWNNQDIQRSLPCVRDEQLRQHAEAHLRAREYHEATREVLSDYRRGAAGAATPPALSAEEVGSIRALLTTEGTVRDEQARAHLQGIINFVSGERRTSDRDAERLLERSLPADGMHARASARAVPVLDKSEVTRPFDDGWFSRLPNEVVLAETRALAVGMRETSLEKHDAARREVSERHGTLEFARWVRDAAGLAEPPPARASHSEKNESANLQRYVSQQLVRDRDWTREQVVQIREFSHRAPDKDQEQLAEALDKTERRLEHARLGLERARIEREQRLFEERIARLNEAIKGADERYPEEVFGRLDLDRLREPERVRQEAERLARQYLDAAKEQGLSPEQVNFRSGSAEDHARLTVEGTVERAEQLRAAWVIAAADSPSFELLQNRLRTAEIEVELAAGGERTAPAVRLKFGDLNLDTRLLDLRIDVRQILSNKQEKPLADKERAVERCVQFALLPQGEQDRHLSDLYRGARGRLKVEEEISRSQYARLAVAAVRSGAVPDWKKIDDKIVGLPPVSERGNTWLVKTAGMTRLNEMEVTARTQPLGRPVPGFAAPDRGLTRPTHDSGRNNKGTRPPGGSGSGGPRR